MPLAADEQVRTYQLAPGLPKVVNLGLYFPQPFEGVGAVVECFEISTVHGPTKQQGVWSNVLYAVFAALDSSVDRPLVG